MIQLQGKATFTDNSQGRPHYVYNLFRRPRLVDSWIGEFMARGRSKIKKKYVVPGIELGGHNLKNMFPFFTSVDAPCQESTCHEAMVS